MYIQKIVNSINISSIFLNDSYQKNNFNILQYDSQSESQVDSNIEIDVQVTKHIDKRETVESDNRRDDSQKIVRIIEMNAVKVFHQIVNICLTSTQNDSQFMRKTMFNVDINEHDTRRIIERESATVNIEHVFYCSLQLIVHCN